MFPVVVVVVAAAAAAVISALRELQIFTRIATRAARSTRLTS